MAARTLETPWGRLRTGTTVVGADRSERTIDAVEHEGRLVNVVFDDGHRELHYEDTYACVVLRAVPAAPRDHSSGGSDLWQLVTRFRRTTDAVELETLADRLGEIDDRRVIPPLICRLGDSVVQDDPDIEDAVCGALVNRDVMRRHGNLVYSFRPMHALDDEAARAVLAASPTLPRRYFHRH